MTVPSLSTSSLQVGSSTGILKAASGTVSVGNLAFSDITTGLGYTPANKAGDTLSGGLKAANVTVGSLTGLLKGSTGTVSAAASSDRWRPFSRCNNRGLADSWYLFDNTSTKPVIIAFKRSARPRIIDRKAHQNLLAQLRQK